MTWLNPAALLGLLALAVPILVHLFGRRVAKRQRFPSLRLLRDAQPTPAARSRPSDVLLLVLRGLTLAAAVAALAQPRWTDSGQARAPARAILIDTSDSMLRLTSDGTTLLQWARSRAERLIDSSSEALVAESAFPGRDIAGATSWLERRSGLRELVVISDFQAGVMDDGHLAAVAPGLGSRFVRAPFAGSIATTHSVEGVTIETTVDGTGASWPPSGSDSLTSVTILAAAADRDLVRRSLAAVRTLAPPARSTRKVSVVFPRAPARRELLAQGSILDSAWQGDLILALARDPVLASLAEPASVDSSCATNGSVVAANWMDHPVASVARGVDNVLVFACVEPGTIAATALIAGIESALAGPPAMQDREPSFLPDEWLRRWERPPTAVSPGGPEVTSPDGRWFWVLALVFLAIEEWLRRRTPRRESPRVNEVRDERVA